MNKLSLKIVGSFATEYSLAIVNRNTAFALDDLERYEVDIWADEQIADRLPKKSDLAKYPKLKELYNPTNRQTDIAIFNDFPKTFPGKYGLDKLNAFMRFAYIGWEESVYPKILVDECNEYLHGIMVISEHTKTVLRSSGIKIPIHVVGLGLDQAILQESKPYPIKTKKAFKFLHISSALPRKGIDIMLRAYMSEFTKDDDVCLVIKTFHNADNQVEELLLELTHDDAPEVEVIYDLDLTTAQIGYLYEQADAVVAPSRAEGFGLPMAEAMLKKKPLITTNYSGQTDFCNQNNCWLLDYDLVDSSSQLPIIGAKWAEPSEEQLRIHMRYLYKEDGSDEVVRKVEKAFNTVEGMSWDKVADKVDSFIQEVSTYASLKKRNVGVVTTINSKCGIAEYSHDLYSKIEDVFENFYYLANTDVGDRVYNDNDRVVRCWEYGQKDFTLLLEQVKEKSIDIVHVQYNPPFYSISDLAKLVSELNKHGVRVYLTLHSVQFDYMDFGKYSKQLNGCRAIFVHSESDKKFLEKKQFKNIELIQHGLPEFVDQSQSRLKERLEISAHPVIASHGLIHDKRGLLQTIDAVKELREKYPDILYLAINAVSPNNSTSSNVFGKMQELVKKNGLEENVLLFPEFLEKSEIITLLHLSDLIVMPYDDLKEGASGAVRTCMAALRPVIITDSFIFKSLEAGYKIEDNETGSIASAVEMLMKDVDLYHEELERTKVFVKAQSWERLSRKFLEVYAG